MEIELTDYEKEKFSKLDTVPMNQWLKIAQDRPDYTEFIACLRKFSSAWHNCLEIDLEKSRFRRIWPKSVIENCKSLNIKL